LYVFAFNFLRIGFHRITVFVGFLRFGIVRRLDRGSLRIFVLRIRGLIDVADVTWLGLVVG